MQESVSTTRVVASQDVARHLDIAPQDARELMASGMLGPVYETPSSRYVELAQVERLAGLPEASADIDGIQARVRCAVQVKDDETRSWKGWSAHLSPQDQAAGVDRWWTVSDAEQLVGQLFIATLCGFVVHTGRITRVHRHLGLVRFEVDTTDRAAAEYAGRRMRGKRGGRLIRLRANA